MNFDYAPVPQFGQPGDYYSQGFNFQVGAYPNLSTEPQLPPNPSNLFPEYPPVYPPAPVHPHMSVSSGQGHMYPPSLSEYPSNGTYPWGISSPPPASHPPAPQRAEGDQRLPEEMFGMFDQFEGYEGYEGYEGFYLDPQVAPYANNSNFSPFTAGQDYTESSPPSSLLKPELDDTFDPEGLGELEDDETDMPIDMPDLVDQLPEGITERHLLVLKIPDLNKLLKDLGLGREEQNLVKRIRRQYKNRGYANTCRKKKDERKSTMKEQKQCLQVEINVLKDDVDKLKLERDRYKRNYEIMQQNKNAAAAL